MTDLPSPAATIPARLGATARLSDGQLVLDLEPVAQTVHCGVVRASVLTLLVDAVAGLVVDDDPDSWAFTTDLTIRMRAVPSPARVSATCTVLRRGGRSATSKVEITDDLGELVALGAIGFAQVRRRADDPPKPVVTPEMATRRMRGLDTIDRPLREEAGIEVLDPKAGVVQVTVRPELTNPAGTLQGAMVALVAEAAAEDLVATRFDTSAVVTDLDIRYLAKATTGPVRTSACLLGDEPTAPIEVTLTDTSTGQITTLVHARATTIS